MFKRFNSIQIFWSTKSLRSIFEQSWTQFFWVLFIVKFRNIFKVNLKPCGSRGLVLSISLFKFGGFFNKRYDGFLFCYKSFNEFLCCIKITQIIRWLCKLSYHDKKLLKKWLKVPGHFYFHCQLFMQDWWYDSDQTHWILSAVLYQTLSLLVKWIRNAWRENAIQCWQKVWNSRGQLVIALLWSAE